MRLRPARDWWCNIRGRTASSRGWVITNYSTVPMTDWKLEFDMPMGQSISRVWSSTFTQYGTHYVITPTWNRVIPPGGSANGGIRGVLSGTYTPPSNCVLNGQVYCS